MCFKYLLFRVSKKQLHIFSHNFLLENILLLTWGGIKGKCSNITLMVMDLDSLEISSPLA